MLHARNQCSPVLRRKDAPWLHTRSARGTHADGRHDGTFAGAVRRNRDGLAEGDAGR